MKTLGLKMVTLLLLMVGSTAFAQSNVQEVPGDDFRLEGALELFKKSGSPEEFERLLNAEDSKVNNLDLNGDGSIDYLRVIDRNDGNVHAFIIQSVISDSESQDVAVIELEKLANGKATLQITGDEDVYGMETIIEPTQEVRVNAGTSTARTTVNVWAWPSVQYVYSPYYTVWVSPWAWSVRPVWYRSWRPVAYYSYYSYWTPYRPYYARCYTHRAIYARDMYRPYRTTSVMVRSRHQTQVAHYRSVHRDDRTHSRYDHNSTTARNDYRSDRSNTVRSRERDRSTPTVTTSRSRNQSGRPDVSSDDLGNRDRSYQKPSEIRSHSTVQPRNEIPTRRQSGGEISRNRTSEPQRTNAVTRPERSRSSAGHTAPARSQPSRERTKRSR